MENNKHIFRALAIANDLMALANDQEALQDSIGCGILNGVMRDCAYKIRQTAERQYLLHKVAEAGGID